MGLGSVEAAGAGLAYRSSGEGPAVLFVHGPALGAEVFRDTLTAIEALEGRAIRAVDYDRRAYRKSETFEPFRATTISEQAEDAVALIDALELAPVLVVGFDVGALVALDLLLRHRSRLSGAVLVEPALLSLVAEGREAVAALREVVETGVRDGGPGGAVEAYLEHAGGPGTLERLGQDRLNAARKNARPFAADLAAGPAWRYAPRDLRELAAPVTVVSGERSARARRGAAAALAQLLPDAELVELDAGHLVPLEDPNGLARVVRTAVGAAR
ncbi:MAG: alpha/beta fold hydrolase [Thermoleophilaceae bacterium]